MSKYIDIVRARAARENGTKIGSVALSSDTKWTGWDVFLHDGEIIACVVDACGGILGGESIIESELPLYVEDLEDALDKLRKVTDASAEGTDTRLAKDVDESLKQRRLEAAAPELLELLKKAKPFVELCTCITGNSEPNPDHQAFIEQISAVIRKAEGE